MFGKKKEEKRMSPLEARVMNKEKDVKNACIHLQSCVENVIVKNNVVALYPEGADKAKAIIDAEQSKQYLLDAIAQYDEAYREYEQLIAKLAEEDPTQRWHNGFVDSHKVVEVTYRNFYQR